MQEILLIRGGGASRALDVLAVAAELTTVFGGDTQIDVAVPAECADYLSLSTVLRRVIAVSPPAGGGWSDMAADLTKSGNGLGGKLLSAAKKLSTTARSNVRTYWQLKEELRLTQYDVVFDFDFSAFSIAVGKLAKAEKVVGFDPKMLNNPLPGAMLAAHDIYTIKGEMSPSSRLRMLPARFFDYRAASEQETLDWQLRPCDTPALAPAAPYMVVTANLPAPFMKVAEQSGLPLVPFEETLPAVAGAGLVQSAAVVVGNGIATALAAATGVKNLYIGSKLDKPHQAIYIATPVEFAEALAQKDAAGALIGEEAAAAKEAAATDEAAAADKEGASDAVPPATADKASKFKLKTE